MPSKRKKKIIKSNQSIRKARAKKDYDGLVEEFDVADDFVPEPEPEPEIIEPEVQNVLGGEEHEMLFKETCEEIERYLTLDRLACSYHNTITVSCLEVCI